MTSETITEAPARGAADRGRTTIDDRVRRRLVEHAALSVPGTVRHRGLAAHRLPAVRFAGRSDGEVRVQVAARWPVDAGRLVSSVRSAVSDELAHSLGTAPEAVQVHIARVDDDRDPETATPHVLISGAPPDTTTGTARRAAPRRTAGASLVAVPLLLGVLGLGLLALRDTAVSFGWAGGDRWIDAVPRIADDLRWSWWTWPAAITLLVVGAALLVVAVTPRRRSHRALTDELWLDRRAARRRRDGKALP